LNIATTANWSKYITVACVNTYFDQFAVVAIFNDPGDLLQFKADITALPGSIFDDRHDSVGGGKGLIYTFGDPLQTFIHFYLFQVAAGVEIQPFQPQGFAAEHFFGKRFVRGRRFTGIGLPQIDQVAVVRQDHAQVKVMLLAVGLKSVNIFRLQRRCVPLTLIFGEQRKSIRSDSSSVQWSIEYSAGSADMGSKIFHKNKNSVFFRFKLANRSLPV